MVKRFLEDRGEGRRIVGLDASINEHVYPGMQRGMAAESIYKERCIAVDDGGSWAKYMSISGSPDDEYDIISEECLLTVDENREGQAAAFGDDIAIGCLATEFKREIFVVRRHRSLISFLFSLFFAYAHFAWNSDFIFSNLFLSN
ncbi:hypothetical protein CK203_081956 [Vitis vinifera]|uniref:Uncharacterized protein n=2 Tax=Vitis vinifera TaxID=29760 RepID=A0A438DXF1_VITVI|nr:hypothetical protein CK203_081953 [Vitis vinifera]RVW40067.1 hypothetical protein CK203_081956 [Vitis vinifera]